MKFIFKNGNQCPSSWAMYREQSSWHLSQTFSHLCDTYLQHIYQQLYQYCCNTTHSSFPNCPMMHGSLVENIILFSVTQINYFDFWETWFCPCILASSQYICVLALTRYMWVAILFVGPGTTTRYLALSWARGIWHSHIHMRPRHYCMLCRLNYTNMLLSLKLPTFNAIH